MKEKFGGTFQKTGSSLEEEKLKVEQDKKNKEFDEMIYKRSNDRFVKEMETRKFVDEQIQKNRSLNSTTDIIKNAELRAEIDAFNSYTQDEEKKRVYLRERNTKHVNHVKG